MSCWSVSVSLHRQLYLCWRFHESKVFQVSPNLQKGRKKAFSKHNSIAPMRQDSNKCQHNFVWASQVSKIWYLFHFVKLWILLLEKREGGLNFRIHKWPTKPLILCWNDSPPESAICLVKLLLPSSSLTSMFDNSPMARTHA